MLGRKAFRPCHDNEKWITIYMQIYTPKNDLRLKYDIKK